MRNLKLSYKIILINIVLAFIISLLINIADGGDFAGEFAFLFGILCLGGALINLFLGFIFIFTNTPEWRNGFLLSGAALLLLSGISCGGGAIFL